MLSQLSVTTWLAVGGFAIALFTLGWNVKRDVADRGRVKITAFVGRASGVAGSGVFYLRADVRPPNHVNAGPPLAVLTAVNVGRRAVRIKGWAGDYIRPVNGNKQFIAHTSGVHVLNEGEDYSIELELALFENVKTIFALDTRARAWKIGGWELRKLKADCKKYSTNHPE